MKKFSSYLVLFFTLMLTGILLFSCKSRTAKETTTPAVEQPAATPVASDEGWTVLFNGIETTGWRGYGKIDFPQSGWVVEDGALKCQGSGQGEAGGKGGDIIYYKKFKDFRLKLEWKISPGGNSGIFYLAQETAEPIWHTAPEMQVLDNDKHPDALLGKNGNRKAGSLYDLIPAVPQNTKPAGEWNSVEIMVYQGTVVHKMNGETVVEYHLGTPEWEKLVKESKFKDMPGFGKYQEGYIGLQDHGNDVWFRNIKILEL